MPVISELVEKKEVRDGKNLGRRQGMRQWWEVRDSRPVGPYVVFC